MSNYFVSYDLNRPRPTHAEMDAHLKKLGNCVHRVLETVWYVRSTKDRHDLYMYVGSALSTNDRLLVIDARDCEWSNLLVPDEALQKCWNA